MKQLIVQLKKTDFLKDYDQEAENLNGSYQNVEFIFVETKNVSSNR